jgi:hypothetical protein
MDQEWPGLCTVDRQTKFKLGVMMKAETVELQVSVPVDLLVKSLVEKILHGAGQRPPLAAHVASTGAPRIGEYWAGQGGIYAGVQRGRDGAADYHLIVGPAMEACNWESAKKQAAAAAVDGHSDFTLPFRKEQALQFANVPELFEQEYYWSSEQLASDSDYAWVQGFNYGGQTNDRKSYEFRARAVRRLVIQ